MTHLTDDQYLALLAGEELDEPGQDHLAGCDKCLETLALLLEQAELDCDIDDLLAAPELDSQLDAVAARHAPAHLEDDEIEALAAGRHEGEAKSRALKHLEHCDSCGQTFDALVELRKDQARTAALLEDPVLEAQLDALAQEHAPTSPGTAMPVPVVTHKLSWLRAPMLVAALVLSVGSIAAIDLLHRQEMGWASERYRISQQRAAHAERQRAQRITELEAQVSQLRTDQPQSATRRAAEERVDPRDAGEVERLTSELAEVAEDRARQSAASQAQQRQIEAEVERLKTRLAEERQATQQTIAVLETEKQRLERSLSLLKARPEVLQIFRQLEIPDADQAKFWNLPAETITEFERNLEHSPEYFQAKTARVGVMQWIARKSS